MPSSIDLRGGGLAATCLALLGLAAAHLSWAEFGLYGPDVDLLLGTALLPASVLALAGGARVWYSTDLAVVALVLGGLLGMLATGAVTGLLLVDAMANGYHEATLSSALVWGVVTVAFFAFVYVTDRFGSVDVDAAFARYRLGR